MDSQLLGQWQTIVSNHPSTGTFRLSHDVEFAGYSIPAGTEVVVWQKATRQQKRPVPRLGAFYLADAHIVVYNNGSVQYVSAPESNRIGTTPREHRNWGDLNFESQSRKPPGF